MRTLALVAAVASAQFVPPKTKKHNTEGGISKVITLMTDMKKQIADDLEKDAGIYDKYACYCKEERETVGDRIEDAKSNLVRLTKSIGVASSLIAEAKHQIKVETANIAREKKKQKNLKSVLAKDEEAFAKRKSEHTETLNVLSRAIGALTKKRSFLEVEDVEVKKQLALVETLTGKSVGEGTMGAATGYLVEMKKQTAVDLQQQTKDILKSRASYNKEILVSMQAVAQHEEIKATQEGILAVNMEKKGEDVKEYNANKKAMDADVKFFDTLTADCEKRSNFYAGQVRDAHAEDDAIDAALPILQSIVAGDNNGENVAVESAGSRPWDGAAAVPAGSGGAAAVWAAREATGFVQMSLNSRVDSTSRAIARLSSGYKAKVLTLMNDKEASSSVGKLVSTCESMVETLKIEIKDVETNKATCISETHRLEQERIAAEKATQTAQNAVDATIEALEHKNFQVEDTTGKLNRSIQKTEDLKGQCKASISTLTNQKAELQAELKAIEQAITAISAAYGEDAVAAQAESERYEDADISRKEGQPDTDFANTKDRRSGGSAIVQMLKMIHEQVAKNLENTGTENGDTKDSCKNEVEELEAANRALEEEKAALEGEKVALEGQKQVDEKTLGEKEDLEGESEDAQEAYGNCAQKIPVYNNAIASKYADIDGLQLVISHLSNIDQDYRSKGGVE